MLAVRSLAKRFGDVVALQDVSFEVGRGEIVGFLGPNGAGKTTTLRILSTFLTPDAGSATVGGHDTAREPMAVRRKLGYLPEHPPLYLDHTVREYLGFCAALRGVPRRRRRSAVDGAIARCGLGEVGDRLLQNLSKGFRQRVGLAQALVHGPEVLILDEPTVGLDPQQIREIRELIRALAGEHTVLLSTHILPEVAAVCGRVVIVHRGRVVADAPVTELTGAGSLEEAFLRVTAGDTAEGAA
ncbi:MAG TPA: ATP-binding cassette domain-containing protein [Candidatus Polarisedimenticolaceae bacterium]|nr:ATP-binding cassette domain-containing protein [Candidatus Polarisedimenticolaceae bacterium]